jgi:hypothetical protein
MSEYKLRWKSAFKKELECAAVFEIPSNQETAYPWLLIQVHDMNGMPADLYEKYFSSDIVAKELDATQMPEQVKAVLSNYTVDKVSIDKQRHRVFTESTSSVRGIGQIKTTAVGCIGRTAAVWLFCIWDKESEAIKNEHLTQILDSFEFDFGYRFEDKILEIQEL